MDFFTIYFCASGACSILLLALSFLVLHKARRSIGNDFRGVIRALALSTTFYSTGLGFMAPEMSAKASGQSFPCWSFTGPLYYLLIPLNAVGFSVIFGASLGYVIASYSYLLIFISDSIRYQIFDLNSRAFKIGYALFSLTLCAIFAVDSCLVTQCANPVAQKNVRLIGPPEPLCYDFSWKVAMVGNVTLIFPLVVIPLSFLVLILLARSKFIRYLTNGSRSTQGSGVFDSADRTRQEKMATAVRRVVYLNTAVVVVVFCGGLVGMFIAPLLLGEKAVKLQLLPQVALMVTAWLAPISISVLLLTVPACRRALRQLLGLKKNKKTTKSDHRSQRHVTNENRNSSEGSG